VPFWPGATPDRWIGLVGIDVEIAPGEYRVALRGATVTGIAVESEQALAIAPKAFRQRQLRVDPRFTHPPESVMPRIREEAERLEALFSTTTCVEPPASAFGLPSADRPSSPFGSRSIFNGEPRGRHNGVDFASPRGAPIVAPAHGRVVLADDLYFTGNTVVLEHGCGIYSLFAHLDRTAVELEARVHRGQRLGDVGSTGRSTGPHLHWSVRVQGAKVDPLALVALSAPAR